MLYVSLFFKNHTFKKKNSLVVSYKHSITNVEKKLLSDWVAYCF